MWPFCLINSLTKSHQFMPVALIAVLATLALIWSTRSNHVNVESRRNKTRIQIWKPPYFCQMPAQAPHDCVLNPAHLRPNLSPVTSKRNEASGHYCTPPRHWLNRFHLSGYVAGSGTAWHISERTWTQQPYIIREHPGKKTTTYRQVLSL